MMFRRITKALARKLQQPTRGTMAFLRLESLEDRTLMTAQPFLYTTLKETADFGNTFASAKAVNLAAMMETQVQGSLTTNNDIDTFRVGLKKGQIFTAQAQLAAMPTQPSVRPVVSLLNSQGAAIAGVAAGESVLYRVSQDGTYYLKLARTDAAKGASSTSRAYELDLHPIGLDNSNLDPKWLRQTGGGMWTWLDGNTLYISGASGHGFGIQANWTQKTTADKTGAVISTYTAPGNAFLQTALGLHTMGVASDLGFVVKTKAQPNGDAFGEVSSLEFTTTLSLSKLITPFGMTSAWGFDLGFLNVDVAVTAQSGIAGIALGGDTALQKSGVPLNAAVPYLYFSVKLPVVGTAAIVVDPSDVALYVNSPKGIKLGYAELNGIGFSQHGLIPYTPVRTPSQYTGQLSGHLLLQGSVDTTAITWVPSKVEGDVLFNIDPNRAGKFFGGLETKAADLANIFADLDASGEGLKRAFQQAGSPIKAAADQYFRSFSVGVNGTLKINPFSQVQDELEATRLWLLNPDATWLDYGLNYLASKAADHKSLMVLSVGNGSMIYDGPTLSTFFRGGSVNPFQGTPLEILGSRPTLDVDGAMKFGTKAGIALFLDIKGQYNVGPFPAQGEVMIANAYSLAPALASKLTGKLYSPTLKQVTTSGVYASQKINVLGANVELTGRVQPNGNFLLKGQSDLDLGAFKAKATFTLTKTSTAQYFTAVVDGSVKFEKTIAGTKWTAKASVTGSLTITRKTTGKFSFAGSLKASGKVTSPIGSAKIDINVKVDDDQLVFELPKIGTKRITLPV